MDEAASQPGLLEFSRGLVVENIAPKEFGELSRLFREVWTIWLDC